MEKNNVSFLKFFFNVVKVIVWIFVILIVSIILFQRLFNNNVSIGSYRMFTIATGSMEPEYQVNDVIISKEVSLDSIKAGDDLVYLGAEGSYKDKVITHRVIRVNKGEKGYAFTTKGIANPSEDPEISGDNVYGIVTYRPVVLSFLSHILNNSYGQYFLIIVPIAFLIFLEILDKIKERENGEIKTSKEED